MFFKGFEANFATNVLGPYILTTLLIPALAKENDSRVVSVLQISIGLYSYSN